MGTKASGAGVTHLGACSRGGNFTRAAPPHQRLNHLYSHGWAISRNKSLSVELKAEKIYCKHCSTTARLSRLDGALQHPGEMHG